MRRLLSNDEISWLDGYHARVREVICPLVGEDVRDWLDFGHSAALRALLSRCVHNSDALAGPLIQSGVLNLVM